MPCGWVRDHAGGGRRDRGRPCCRGGRSAGRICGESRLDVVETAELGLDGEELVFEHEQLGVGAEGVRRGSGRRGQGQLEPGELLQMTHGGRALGVGNEEVGRQ